MTKRTSKKAKSASSPTMKACMVRVPAGKCKLFAKKSEAIAFAEKQTKAGNGAGCEIVEFDAKGKQVSVLTLNLKLEPTYVWSDE